MNLKLIAVVCEANILSISPSLQIILRFVSFTYKSNKRKVSYSAERSKVKGIENSTPLVCKVFKAKFY